MSALPHCNGTELLIDLNSLTHYYPNQHIYVGAFYIIFFVVTIVPQFFLLYTCLQNCSMSESCYKLMTIVCVCDIVNLFNCMLTAGIFSIFGINHCNSGIGIIYYGQFVMFAWYAYCIANLILAFNRLFQFLDKRICRFLFYGYRSYAWIAVVIVYAVALCVFAPNPFYMYDSSAGVWYFFWLQEITVNYFHVYNNMIKLGLMIMCYIIVLILIRKQLNKAHHTVSDFERRLSIQACIIASACAAGNITYLVTSYLPMGNSPISGTIGEFLWGVQHSAAGFVYLLMNKAVQKNVYKFLMKIGMRGKNSILVQTIRTDTTL